MRNRIRFPLSWLLGLGAVCSLAGYFLLSASARTSPYSKRVIAQSLRASVTQNEFPATGEIQ
ncbi:hypothetical protein EBR78_04780, partial [bacterium]|nr:hypothetical protein [bacterium]